MGQPIRYFIDSNYNNYYDYTINGFNIYNEEYQVNGNYVIEEGAEVIMRTRFHITGDLIINGTLDISDFGIITVDGNIILNTNGKLIITGAMYCKLEFIENGVLYISENGFLEKNVIEYILELEEI